MDVHTLDGQSVSVCAIVALHCQQQPTTMVLTSSVLPTTFCCLLLGDAYWLARGGYSSGYRYEYGTVRYSLFLCTFPIYPTRGLARQRCDK